MEVTVYVVTMYVYWDDYTAHIKGWEIFKNKTDAEIFIHNDNTAEVYTMTPIKGDISKIQGV